MEINCNVLTMKLSNFETKYWREGNDHLEISLPNDQMILRFIKCDVAAMTKVDQIKQYERKMIMTAKFVREIMGPLLGEAFAPIPSIQRISEEELAVLNDKLFTIRPSNRWREPICSTLITGQPDFSTMKPTQTVLPDGPPCTGVLDNGKPIYTVQIKPKQGWVHEQDRVGPACTFCSKQLVKLAKRSIKKISGYCPLDLFSGNSVRIKKAIKYLMRSPQKYFKIYKDGDLIYENDSSNYYLDVLKEILEPHCENTDANRLEEKFASLLKDALLTPMSNEKRWDKNTEQNNNTEQPKSMDSLSCDYSGETLPDNCILQRILSIQKLQNRSSSTIYEIYSAVQPEESDFDYIDRMDNTRGFHSVDRFLMSSSAKDCTLFVTFQPVPIRNIELSHRCLTDFDGMHYRFKVGVVDIDPKPLSYIQKCINKNMNC